MNLEPLVSVVVNNYNYGRFLTEAVDSALDQTYSRTEVIVVDDGSTDQSRELIVGYGDRILAIQKDNGGQASAFNAGFARSRGEVVLFLDADDVLGKDAVRRVAEAFHRDSRLAGVHYRLRVIDESGRETNDVLPPAYLPLPNGDLSGNWAEVFNCANWPPTSGNAFSAWSLRRILPMPEEEFRVNADYYLTRVNALCGTVLALEEVGAYYRVHGANRHFTDRVDLDQIRRQVVLTAAARAHIKAFAHRQGSGETVGTTLEDDDEIFLAQRLISCKLDSKNHPIQEDRSGLLWRRGLRAALRRSCLSLPVQAIHVLWFVGMGLLPRGMAKPLAKQFFPPTRRRLNRALNVLQRQTKWPRRPVAR